MQKKTNTLLTALLLLCVIVSATAFVIIKYYALPAAVNTVLSVALDKTKTVMQERSAEIEVAIAAQKAEGVFQAETVAALINKGGVDGNSDLKKMVGKGGILAIHVLDKTGKLVWSSMPTGEAISVHNNTQLKAFVPIYKNRLEQVSYLSELRGNGLELRQYSGVFLQYNQGIVVVETTPILSKKLLLSTPDLDGSLAGVGGYLFLIKSEDQSIVYHPNVKLIGSTLDNSVQSKGSIKLDEQEFWYVTKRVDDNILVAVIPKSVFSVGSFVSLILFVGWSVLIVMLFYLGVSHNWSEDLGGEVNTMVSALDTVLEGGPLPELGEFSTKELDKLGGRISTLISAAKEVAVESEQVKISAESASDAKTTFLANMSHEIRTPLNGIIGFAELALDESVTESARVGYIKKIKTSGDGLLSIINDILDLSKIESGKLEIENVEFDLHDMIDACRSLTVVKAESKGVMLSCCVDPTIDRKIVGDVSKLKQVLLNLLSNAVKFTSKGAINLLVEKVSAADDQIRISFEVKDSGIGMSSEQIEKVFSPFTQADSSTTREFGGTGLGLTISKQIVEELGGELKLESVLGIGSRFRFELCFGLTDVESTARPLFEQTEMERPKFTGEVLVFEDNEINQEVVCDHLARIGLKATVASNGLEGIDEYNKREKSVFPMFKLILMDIHMPEMDGLEATRCLLQRGCKLPIIAMTANVIKSGDTLYSDAGFSDFLSKPFQSQDLWRCLSKYLSQEEKISPTPTTKRKVESAPIEDTKLLAKFVKSNKDTVRNLFAAIANGDTKTAHRIAHTLKGLAALIKEPELHKAALTVERGLERGKVECSQKQLDELRQELERVMSSVPNTEEPSEQVAGELNSNQVDDLFNRTRCLLTAGSAECLDLVGELQKIPGTTKLVQQIEQCDFEIALSTLATLVQEV